MSTDPEKYFSVFLVGSETGGSVSQDLNLTEEALHGQSRSLTLSAMHKMSSRILGIELNLSHE